MTTPRSPALIVRRASPDDLVPALELLKVLGVSRAVVAANWDHYLVLVNAAHVVSGLVGLEVRGTAGVVRSVAVEPSARGRGQGRRLIEAVRARARRERLTDLFLVTYTQRDFYARLRFSPVSVDDCPDEVVTTLSFQQADVSAGWFMHCPLSPSPRPGKVHRTR